MILQALLAYAERENLGDADFEAVGVRWQIPLTADGKLAGSPIPLSDDPAAKKPRPKRLVRPKSDPDFVSHGRSYFLCDSLERCALFLDDLEKVEKRKTNQSYFIGLLREAADACPSRRSCLLATATFLANQDSLSQLHERLRSAKAQTSDNAIFAVDGLSLLDMPELCEWWRAKNQRIREEQDISTAVCLASGRTGAICRTTGFIKLLGEDTKLISFNKECPAFESFNFSQAANAAIGVDVEEKIRAAFNALIQRSNDQRLVFDETIYLHWTREPVAFDPLDLLATADPDGVAHLLQSVQTGSRQLGLDANAYYCLGLSGNGARIVVRDWLDTTVERVEVSVADWFRDIELIDPDGAFIKSGFSLGQLLWGLANPKLKNPYEILPAAAGESLIRASIAGTSLPPSLLSAALKRERVDRVSRDEDNHPRPMLPARLSLIRAVLNRLPNQNITMSAQLDPACSDPAYLCGRLFAVFAELQPIALESVNAGVVERFYASASVTPALVMGRLFRNAQNHLSKADGRGGWRAGAAVNIGKDFEEITSALGCKFPPTLTLEEQGRFALGFYHQKADYRRQSAERREERTTATAASA